MRESSIYGVSVKIDKRTSSVTQGGKEINSRWTMTNMKTRMISRSQSAERTMKQAE